MQKISIKREQSQAGLSFAEREKFRPQVKNKLLLLLALLMTAATGAWAQTTHVVTQATVNDIFSGGGYTLGNAVKAGDVLDFQDTIDIDHSLVINKPVNIISSEKNAVINLHTVAGPLTGEAPGNSFIINKAGSGTTVQDIRIENTQTWLYNTSNVTFTGVTIWVEEARVGSGVGHVAIRYSDHITFDGCTVYTKNNGGSSACVLTYSGNCTFKDTHIEAVGNVGNPLYLGNVYNVDDMPSGFTGACNDCVVTGCTIKAGTNSAICRLQVSGLRHRFENCTVDIGASFSSNVTVMTNGKSSSISAASADDGYIIRNNTFAQGMGVPAFSTAEGNTVSGGSFTVSKGSTVTNNDIIGNVTINYNSSDYTGSTITGNSILGKVTFSSNSKNNTFTGNTVISSEAYAVVMASTKDANNTVTDNILLAASNAGDAAVNLNNGTGNTISNNLSEATAGDATWNFDAATGTLTIGGTGAIADFEQTTGGQTTAPWAFLSDKITRIVIGDGVTKVGSNAFADCTALNDVFVKGTGTLTIGTNAIDPSATPAIYVPVGNEAAYQTAWSDYAGSISGYMSCGDNASAVYDATTHTLTICGTGAMTDFASAADQPWKALQGQVQNVIIEPTITAIGTNAFSGCTALTTANIEGTLTIADGAFDGNATGRRIFVPVAAIAGYGESTYAADIYSTGQCGPTGSEGDITWELNAKTMALSISGTGAMADYASSSNVPWYSARTLIKSATIGSGITTVGKNAFPSCTGMATVSIPATVTSIGSYAFSGCSALTAIDIPATVTTIGDHAFQSCGLTTFVIPAGVTEITQGCFRDCSKLATINIPSNVTTIGDYAFCGCSILNNVTIPDGVTTIGNAAFSGCAALTAIVIPDGVTTIGNAAFSGCAALTAIVIPDGVTRISADLFEDCANLASVNIPAGVTEIGSWAFSGTALTTVNIPDGVTSIGASAFRSCTKLESITIPDGVTSIGNYAFYECSMLESITIPASVTSIGSYAFRDCSMLTEVYIFAPSLQTYGGNAFRGTHADLKIYVPAASVDTYKAGWSAYADKIQALPFYTVTFADGVNPEPPAEPEWSASPATDVKKGQTVTVTYSGDRKVIGVKAEKKVPLIVNPAVGQFIGSDGKNYDANATLPDGVTAVAMIAYVGSSTGDATYNHGLALALTDESSSCMDWNNAKTACTNKNTSATVNSASWMLPSKDQWNKMIDACKNVLGTQNNYQDLRDGFSGITGASNLQSNIYWSSTEVEGYPSDAWMFSFGDGSWYDYPKSNDDQVWVRACLAF